MAVKVSKNREFYCWLTAIMTLTFFSTLFVNVVFAQSDIQYIGSESKIATLASTSNPNNSMAYVYSSDTSSANSYKSLLGSNDLSTSAVNRNDRLNADISKNNTTISGEFRSDLSTLSVNKNDRLADLSKNNITIGGIRKGGNGEIIVSTELSWEPGSSTSYEDITFTISGQETYSGSPGLLGGWSKSDVPAGTYTINYGPISGYETPASETKTLNAGDSITFSGTYSLKKRAGDTLDVGDGYIILIKQIDLGKNETLMELQLDGRIIDQKRVKENEDYAFQKYGDDTRIVITPLYTSLDAGGEYTNVYRHLGVNFLQFRPHTLLSIISNPGGADVSIDGEYVGKTSKKGEAPKTFTENDLSVHSVHLELQGYDSWEGEYKFDSLTNPKEIKVILNKTKNSTPVTTEALYTPTEATPNITETEAAPGVTETDATPDITETEATTSTTKTESTLSVTETSPAKTETSTNTKGEEDTPGFLGITALIILLIGCLIMYNNR
jgi:hypothetical protein